MKKDIEKIKKILRYLLKQELSREEANTWSKIPFTKEGKEEYLATLEPAKLLKELEK